MSLLVDTMQKLCIFSHSISYDIKLFDASFSLCTLAVESNLI